MSKALEKLQNCMRCIREKMDFQPEVALILGSGLGDYAESIDIRAEVSYREIEGFPVSTVPGHKGRFVFGYVNQVPVVIMQGRVHYYEGYSMEEVVLPTRLMGMMGARKLLLTNAAGGINFDFAPGDFMLITDHISSMIPNPLIGTNLEELGPRFPDMSEVYSRHMGMEICGISCITNLAAGMSARELNHAEVQETADRVAKQFKELVTAVVTGI